MTNLVDTRVLILGASSISMKAYENLANEINTDEATGSGALVVAPANNPNHTKDFVDSVKADADSDVKIFKRALKCIDEAVFVIVDLSAASTGVGMEVTYLLTTHADKNIVFIAKEGSKISPHIKGMYKHMTGKDLQVEFYKDEKDMPNAVRRSSAYNQFYYEMIY